MPGPIRSTLSAEQFAAWKAVKDQEREEALRVKEQERQAAIQAGTQQMTGQDSSMQGTKPFAEFSELSVESLAVLKRLKFKLASPVQEACIPLFTGNKDVAVEACTGSGKTLAFVLPVAEKLRRLEEPLKKCQVGALIVSPTRELAKQIFEVAAPFLETISWVRRLLLVGGGDPSSDVKAFEESGGNFIVSTPGRLLDVIKRSQLMSFKNLEVLVLDEADRLLDLGFRKQLDQILQNLPKQRRTGLFSATQTEAVEELSRAGLRNPVRVKVAVRPADTDHQEATKAHSQRTPMGLTINYHICESTEKLGLLLNFLKEHEGEKVIVFALTCAMVEYLGSIARHIEAAKGLKVWTLHGRMKQPQRQAALQAFASQPAGALLCTDVAARGLDIPDVNWILQLDPPQDPDAVVHRVGRTARMGKRGNALIFLLSHEESYVEFLKVRKVPMQPIEDMKPSADLMPALRKLSESDRDLLEKGIRAFVSYVRGYKEHQCRFIFQLKGLDLGKLAYACGLLQLPRMPEIRKVGGKVAGFTPSEMNPNDVQFKDKARQKARAKKLVERSAEKLQESQKSGKQSAKEKAPREQQSEKHLPAAKRRLLEDQQDMSEFADEYTLLKRLKKGKMTEEEFDEATGLLKHDLSDNDGSDLEQGSAKSTKHQSHARGQKKSEKKFKKLKAKKASFGQRKSKMKGRKPKR